MLRNDYEPGEKPEIKIFGKNKRSYHIKKKLYNDYMNEKWAQNMKRKEEMI